MKITKMHGAGNDFILMNNLEERIPDEDLNDLAIKLCHRRLSIGGDGLIVADHSDLYDIKMVFINADGSRGEMCGNGARCFARFCYEEGLVKETMTIDTLAGKVEASRIDEHVYKVRLPNPSVIREMDLSVSNQDIEATYVELGNPGVPHLCVELHNLDTISQEVLFELGKSLRWHQKLNKGANVNFYKKITDTRYLEKTFERGVEDFTLACGTGSASVAVTLWTKFPHLKDKRIELEVPGGLLKIDARWNKDSILELNLIGPTEVVFKTKL